MPRGRCARPPCAARPSRVSTNNRTATPAGAEVDYLDEERRPFVSGECITKHDFHRLMSERTRAGLHGVKADPEQPSSRARVQRMVRFALSVGAPPFGEGLSISTSVSMTTDAPHGRP